MSGTKAMVESVHLSLKAAVPGALPLTSGRTRTVRHFRIKRDGPLSAIDDDQPASPAVELFLAGDTVFEIDGDIYQVARLAPSSAGPQSSTVVIEGFEHVGCPERIVRRAMQVRDLEALVAEDRVDIPFGPSARQYNLDRGWANGSRTLASLGVW